MPKRLLAIITIIALIASMQVALVAEAYPNPPAVNPNQEKPTLTIKNPQNYASYGVDGVTLEFAVTPPVSWSISYDPLWHLGRVANITASLDGKICGTFLPNSTDYSIQLNETALGTHQINIEVFSYIYYTTPASGYQNVAVDIGNETIYESQIVVSDAVHFTVVPPKILILSPQATIYNESSVSLAYSVNETTSLIYFSLDGQTNTTGPANPTLNYLSKQAYNASLYTTILNNLSNGSHCVTVYAADRLGNVGSQTASFTVKKPHVENPNTSSFEPNVAIAAIPVAALCVILGLLLYRRHRKIAQSKT